MFDHTHYVQVYSSVTRITSNHGTVRAPVEKIPWGMYQFISPTTVRIMTVRIQEEHHKVPAFGEVIESLSN